jgi:NAD(P)-dependent dehydrogenase (short-subunit alcohol dehydrogenase family)
MNHLNNLFNQTPLTVILAGVNGAIGQAMLKQLLLMPNVIQIYALSRTPLTVTVSDNRVIHTICDITNTEHLLQLNHQLQTNCASVNVLLNATGLLHQQSPVTIKPEKALSQLTLESLQSSFLVNAFAPILLLKTVLSSMPKHAPIWIANLSARVGSIQDNRLGGWYSYRAAKSAQNQLFKTASIELTRTHTQAICLQLHPGTVDSNLSKPFQAGVSDGKLFTPEYSANCLFNVIASKTVKDTGSFWDWNNQAIPW